MSKLERLHQEKGEVEGVILGFTIAFTLITLIFLSFWLKTFWIFLSILIGVFACLIGALLYFFIYSVKLYFEIKEQIKEEENRK